MNLRVSEIKITFLESSLSENPAVWGQNLGSSTFANPHVSKGAKRWRWQGPNQGP